MKKEKQSLFWKIVDEYCRFMWFAFTTTLLALPFLIVLTLIITYVI